MARLVERLSAVDLPRIAKAPGRHADGRGLYLKVSSPGAAFWMLRYMLQGRAREMGLGPYPEVSLRQAREKALKARSLTLERIDPIDKRRADKLAATSQVEVVTFRSAAERFIETKRSDWKHQGKTADQWTAAFRDWVYPLIGDTPVAEIDTKSVLSVLTQPVTTKDGVKRFWEARSETASRCRSRIENVLDFAKANNERSGDNPADWATLKFTLPKRHDVRAVEHHEAMAYEDVPSYVAKLRARPP